MFCCFPPLRRSSFNTGSDEKKPLLSKRSTINYRSILSIPYANAIRDDKIQIESSNVMEANATNAYLLFNGTITNQAYDATCFSFDDDGVATPVVFTTADPNSHFIIERVFQIDHVTAIGSSTAIRMHSFNKTTNTISNTVSMARPFDEFLQGPNNPNGPPDIKTDSTTTKLDKD